MYIDPTRLLNIRDKCLLFLVLYEFILFIMHELDHCKNLLQKRTVTQYCCTALVIFENISNFVVLMHHTFQNEGKLSNSNPIFKPSRCFTCMMTTCYFSFGTDFVVTARTTFFTRLMVLETAAHGTRDKGENRERGHSCRTQKRQNPSYESEPCSGHRSQTGSNLSSTTGRLYYPVLHTQARDPVDRAGNMSSY